MGLFRKAAIFTDIHFGEHLDSEEHNQDCLDFVRWFCGQTVKNQCDTVIFLGDWFHNRVRTENRTGFYSKLAINALNELNLPIFWIIGNHELYFKANRDIHSLHYIYDHNNIHVIDKIEQFDDVVLSPWIVGDENRDLIARKAKYVFGHFELPFFLMNQVIEKQYDGKGLHIDDFVNCEAVYSGHFHKRQTKINRNKVPIYYVGNSFGHNMNDVNDPERGMAILEWGECLPTYITWHEAPTYHRWSVSEMLTLLDQENQPYGPRAVVEVIDDLGLSTEDLTDLKSIIHARQVRIQKPKTIFLNEVTISPKKYNSLDEMIENKLLSMTYDGKFDADLLIRLYKLV